MLPVEPWLRGEIAGEGDVYPGCPATLWIGPVDLNAGPGGQARREALWFARHARPATVVDVRIEGHRIYELQVRDETSGELRYFSLRTVDNREPWPGGPAIVPDGVGEKLRLHGPLRLRNAHRWRVIIGERITPGTDDEATDLT
jgi:hypothetical protein